MRQLGAIPDERTATRLSDYLLTLGIETRIERTADGFLVWVYQEDRLPQARDELAAFLQHPDNPRYTEALREAELVRRETARKYAAARRNLIDARTIWSPTGIARRRPLTTALILMSIAVSILTQFGQRIEPVLRHLTVADLIVTDNGIVSHKGFYDIERGEVWRAVTPIFIHFGILHLLFDMYMLYMLGGTIEGRYGTRRLALLLIVLAPLPILVEYQMSHTPLIGGMSGVDYGLFGYIWIKSRYDPDSRLFISPNTVFWLLAWFVLCLSGAMGNVANWAHGVGLVSGAIMAYVPLLLRRR